MNKFILVPQTKYRGLIAQPDNLKDTINLSKIGQRLSNVKTSRKLKSSAKNVLMNQQLRGLLKMRKEVQQKPVKVELTENPKTKFDMQVQTDSVNEGLDDSFDLLQRPAFEEGLRTPASNFSDFLKQLPNQSPEESPKRKRKAATTTKKKTFKKKAEPHQPFINTAYPTRRAVRHLYQQKEQGGSGKFVFRPSLWKKN